MPDDAREFDEALCPPSQSKMRAGPELIDEGFDERLSFGQCSEPREVRMGFIAREIRLVCALNRTAPALRLRVRLIALALFRPARLRSAFTSAEVQARRLDIDESFEF